jgi:hypothetical protein
MEIMLKKMTSNDSMTNSVENNKGGTGVIRLFTSLPLSAKLCLLVLAALIPRIIVFLQPQIITNDGMLYVKMAKQFLLGTYEGIPEASFSLYPLMIFLVQKIIEDWELSGQLISMTLGTLTVIPVFLLGRSLYNEKIGWLSGLFYITLPNFLKFDSQVIRDPTLWLFMALTLWLVWEGNKKNQPILFALASVSAGLGAITRAEGFILWGVLTLYTGFRKVSGSFVKRRVLNVAIFVFFFPLLLSPALFVMKEKSTKIAVGEMISYSTKVVTEYTRSILKPLSPIDAMGQKTYDSLPRDSRSSLELASRHRIILAISEVIYKFIKAGNLLIILVLLGFWKRRKEGLISSDRYLLYAFAALFLMSVLYARQLYYFSTRHGLTLVLPSLFFAGHGVDAAVGILSRGMDRLGFGWTLIRRYLPQILILLFIMIFLSQGLGGKGKEETTIKDAGLWLKENGYRGSVVMGPKKSLHLAFYADGKFVEMPNSWEQVMESIRKNGVRILIIDSCTIEQDCPSCLANWSKDGFHLVREIKEVDNNCFLQIYGVR